MPIPARKPRDAQADDTPERRTKKQPRSRDGLIADEFDMDCWEPSLRDKLRNASGRKKS